MIKIYHHLKNSYNTTMSMKKLVKWLMQIIVLIGYVNIILIILQNHKLFLPIVLKKNNFPSEELQYGIFQHAIIE